MWKLWDCVSFFSVYVCLVYLLCIWVCLSVGWVPVCCASPCVCCLLCIYLMCNCVCCCLSAIYLVLCICVYCLSAVYMCAAYLLCICVYAACFVFVCVLFVSCVPVYLSAVYLCCLCICCVSLCVCLLCDFMLLSLAKGSFYSSTEWHGKYHIEKRIESFTEIFNRHFQVIKSLAPNDSQLTKTTNSFTNISIY